MSKIILLGDSITLNLPFRIDNNYQSRLTQTRKSFLTQGIIGNETDNVLVYAYENIGVGLLHRVVESREEKYNADIYIVQIGINNILRPKCDYDNLESIDNLIDKIKNFVEYLKNIRGGEVILQSLYPTKEEELNEKILYVNKKLKNISIDINITYLDMHQYLTQDGISINPTLSEDGFLPNESCYQLIKEKINEQLSLMQKEEKTKTKKL